MMAIWHVLLEIIIIILSLFLLGTNQYKAILHLFTSSLSLESPQ